MFLKKIPSLLEIIKLKRCYCFAYKLISKQKIICIDSNRGIQIVRTDYYVITNKKISPVACKRLSVLFAK